MDDSAESSEEGNDLDGVRIQRLAQCRKAANRAASHRSIAALACAVGAIDLAWRAVRRIVEFSQIARPAAYLVFAVALAWLAARFWRSASELRREARKSNEPSAPGLPPDFSTLGDGSQMVRNLEEMK